MGEAENPGKLGPQLPGTALMAMILPETGVHPGNVGSISFRTAHAPWMIEHCDAY